MSSAKKIPADEVISGRGTTEWLNGLTKATFGEHRKQKQAADAFRMQMIREARRFAEFICKNMPKSASQLTEKIVRLDACEMYPSFIGRVCISRINTALSNFKKTELASAGKAKERVSYNRRCNLASVPDCATILKIGFGGAHYVTDTVGAVHAVKFTISKYARIAFAAVINVLAEALFEAIKLKFSEVHQDDKTHNITADNVHDAMRVLCAQQVFGPLPVVFDTGSHKRKAGVEHAEDAAKRVKTDA